MNFVIKYLLLFDKKRINIYTFLGGVYMFFETNNFSVCSISAFTLNWGAKIETSGIRPYHALSFRIKGDAKFITKTDTITVKTGDIVFVPAFYNYTLDSGDEEVCVIHFSSNEKLPLKIKKFSPEAMGY